VDDGDGSAFSGRVEHVTSDRAARFTSAKELLAFFHRVLGDIEEQPHGSTHSVESQVGATGADDSGRKCSRGG
jgi:hypothetical protein